MASNLGGLPNGDDAASPQVVIPDEAHLLRRIHPKQIVPDRLTGQPRVSTAAFTDPEMSVDAEPLLVEDHLDWHFSLRNHPGHSLVRFTASIARQADQKVQHKPVPENRAHTEVIGKKTGSVKNRLQNASEWVHLDK
jgi:hypothetical protein